MLRQVSNFISATIGGQSAATQYFYRAGFDVVAESLAQVLKKEKS